MLGWEAHPSLGICCVFNIPQEEKVQPRESRILINFITYKEVQAVMSLLLRHTLYRCVISLKEFEEAQVQLGSYPYY